ncbi:SMC family ATPase [Arthrobacter sp. zg-Y916]|uniref:AAA family ATPase n=1 Tax=Arthrobacter sp. zg-Y916 TaxID=2894190 RepID=UPI001E3BDED4|nr:SMC family ATPase [Arthrobacter sp. zg-Y916]MCC9192993.1 SMC family ATPase [Arthrobacter sp. zg-Y916]
MRIHRLEMQAFGPFADRQSIDFDELGAQGLFLLNGPTGAGKTSVLDAICFALYGSVPGARQEARKLRSDHASPGTPPEVVLDFSAGPRRFKVVRNPQWERPAKRAGSATGTVTEQARTLLSEFVNGEWTQKTARNDEAAAEIQSLLGMSREQFTRVVMLPQGDFAAFLRADATSRADLLQRLFGTWRFEEIERQLKEQTDAARARLAEARSASELLRAQARNEIMRCAKLLGEPAEDEDNPEQHQEAEQDSAWLQSVQDSLAERLDALRAEQEESSSELERAEEALHQLQARRARGMALLQLEADEREHARREAAMVPRRRALKDHDRAAGLAGYLAACASAARSFRNASAAAADSLGELRHAAGRAGFAELVPAGDGGESAAEALPVPAELDGLDEHTAAEISAAEVLLAEAERAAALHRQAAADRTREETLRAEADGVQKTAGTLREEQDELRSGLPALRTAAAAVQASRARMEEAARTQEVIAAYKRALAASAASGESAADARQRYQDQREKWQGLLQLRLDQAAAELASALQDGEGCPVCGSTSHPDPAPLPEDGGFVTREEEAAARQSTEAAEKEWDAARLAAETDAAAVSSLRGQGGEADAGEARRAGEEAERDYRVAQAAAQRLAADEERLRSLEDEIGQLDRRVSLLLQDAAQAQARAAAAEDEAAGLLGRGTDAEPAALMGRVQELKRVRRLSGAARSALQAAGHAASVQEDSIRALSEALDGTGFTDEAAVRAALLPEAEAGELRRGLEELDLESARLAMRRESQDAAALDGDGEPETMPNEEDVAEASESAEAARQAVTGKALQIGLLEGSAAALIDLAGRLAAAEEEMRPLQERHDLLSSVSDTARGNGENSYRMALSTYVLAARLEQVAAAATERLAAMTAGRYSLVHDDSRSGNRRAGLGLHVIDDWTGIRRDTSTLSGGESFMASLALALGLADVVQQEAGGTSMETLFVDEGFGSLDEEALEQVMDALEGLRDGGRVVGLVSHVAEMKQRIGAQLQITRGRNGSTVRFRAAETLPA